MIAYMTHLASPTDRFVSASLRPARSFLVIHDDVPAGIRAKRCADELAAATGFCGEPILTMWLAESLGDPDYAVAAWLNAEKSSVVVLSLKAGAAVSDPLQIWIEAWLQYAAGERTRLVVVAEPAVDEDDDSVLTRSYLEGIAARHGVDCLWVESQNQEPEVLVDRLPVFGPARLIPGPGLFTAAAAFAA
jgi:hypothetical protein